MKRNSKRFSPSPNLESPLKVWLANVLPPLASLLLLVLCLPLTSCTFYTHGGKPLADVVEARKKLEEAAANEDHRLSNVPTLDKSKTVRLDLMYWAILDPRHLIQYEKKLDFTKEHRIEMEGLNAEDEDLVSELLPTLEYISTKQFSDFLLTFILETFPRNKAYAVMEEKHRLYREEHKKIPHRDPSIKCFDDVGRITYNNKLAKRCTYDPIYHIPRHHFTLSLHFLEYSLPMTPEEREEALEPNEMGWTKPVEGATATLHAELWMPTGSDDHIDDGKHILSRLVRKCNDVFQVHDSEYEVTVRAPSAQDILTYSDDEEADVAQTDEEQMTNGLSSEEEDITSSEEGWRDEL
mmetsp:Transcript_27471/g.39329  ORF Transcript_27471/g.39329 Transcript_27471/m.39329 type:complete len:352 (-) Transcript_27471:101-1156(-)